MTTPRDLPQVEQLLDKHDGQVIRGLLWENEIMSAISDVVKQDFGALRVPWSTATRLCALLAKCCMGFKQTTEFINVFLPLVADSFMELANNIQGERDYSNFSTKRNIFFGNPGKNIFNFRNCSVSTCRYLVPKL